MNLSDADGEIVIHLDIESASQRECECILRQLINKSNRNLVAFARPSEQGVNKRFRLSSIKGDARTEQVGYHGGIEGDSAQDRVGERLRCGDPAEFADDADAFGDVPG